MRWRDDAGIRPFDARHNLGDPPRDERVNVTTTRLIHEQVRVTAGVYVSRSRVTEL